MSRWLPLTAWIRIVSPYYTHRCTPASTAATMTTETIIVITVITVITIMIITRKLQPHRVMTTLTKALITNTRAQHFHGYKQDRLTPIYSRTTWVRSHQKGFILNFNKATTITTTFVLWPFVRYPGEPVPEETFTHSLILIIIQPLSVSSIYYDP